MASVNLWKLSRWNYYKESMEAATSLVSLFNSSEETLSFSPWKPEDAYKEKDGDWASSSVQTGVQIRYL